MLLFLSGCSSSRRAAMPELPSAFPYHRIEQIEHFLAANAEGLEAFKAKASFALRAPSRSGSFSANVQSRRGDSLYMTISPGLGIEAVRALVTPDSLFLYNRIENELTYGSLLEAADLLALPVTADDLFDNLLGLLVPPADADWTLEADSAAYYLHDPEGRQHYVVDPALWRVTRYEVRTPGGALIEARTFSDFDQVGDVYLPRRVTFSRPGENTTASFYYRSMELNPADLDFKLRVSDSARRVPVGR